MKKKRNGKSFNLTFKSVVACDCDRMQSPQLMHISIAKMRAALQHVRVRVRTCVAYVLVRAYVPILDPRTADDSIARPSISIIITLI